ncbi:MAG: DUF4386 family protein [Armatimonadota bacterium]|nr:DUF4386 family protein [Armatimonadota bacterium]
MFPRPQTAGLLGILAGTSLVILLLLFMTAGVTMDAFADPATALPRLAQDAGRFRLIAALTTITVALALLFITGLAARLRDKAPTRATGVLYFGVLGLVGHGLGGMIFWAGVPALTARASVDQVAAAHAWVAINALTAALDGFGNLFVGLSILLAGWAVTTGAGAGMSPALGWYGVAAGALTALAVCAPGVEVLMLGAFVLPIVWLLWAGSALRRAA